MIFLRRIFEEILNADPEAEGLVGVTGADPALRRADLELPELRLARVVELHVVRHDHVRVRGDLQPAHVDPAALEALDLVGEHTGVDHDPVADHAELAGMEDPRRDQVEGELLAVADDRVAGVVAALETHDHPRALREQVDDLALALIAPLGSDDCDSRHERVILRSSGGRDQPASRMSSP
jgi:hypothetical protein